MVKICYQSLITWRNIEPTAAPPSYWCFVICYCARNWATYRHYP